MRRPIPFLLVAVACTALTSLPARGADDDKPKHWRVQEAIRSLEQTTEYLRAAQRQTSSRFGDEADQAAITAVMRDVEQATTECESALRATGAKRTLDSGDARRTDRPLAAARESLDEARSLLREAEGDFEGHRKTAIELVEQAHKRVDRLAQQERGVDRSDRDRLHNEDDDVGDAQGARYREPANLPREVRKTVMDKVPDLEIDTVERLTEGERGDRRTVYKIEGHSRKDGNVEMEVTENGDLLSLDRTDRRDRRREKD